MLLRDAFRWQLQAIWAVPALEVWKFLELSWQTTSGHGLSPYPYDDARVKFWWPPNRSAEHLQWLVCMSMSLHRSAEPQCLETQSQLQLITEWFSPLRFEQKQNDV